MSELFNVNLRFWIFASLAQFLTFNKANAQSNRSVYLDYSYGISSPLGDFASRNFNNENAGFAKGGLSSSFTIGYDFTDKGFGLLFKSQSHINIFNADDYAKQLNRITDDGFWYVSGNFYSMSTFMLGVKKWVDLSPKSKLDARVLLGYAIAKTPQIEVYESFLPYWGVELAAYSNTIGFQIGLAYEYQVNKRLSLIANMEYFGASAEFVDIISYTSLGGIYSDTRNQKMNVINTRIGIGVNLN